ncbi:MAG: HlyC/CorC family transporter [Acidobacteria bacterium]|nr:HlyC/CorC family transporter [Acidobacteriota bacterium]MYD70692.1 HlyC/CorC family transporter [Acidobacteriota bacterium]MYJ03310.1 HlyC/CorC family transporter [Acidobacteriota bacterium]
MIPAAFAFVPLLLFLLACASIYVGTVEAAFATLMRLPLRLGAERRGRLDRLGYLDDPLRLFVPARLLQGLVIVAVALLALASTPRNVLPVVVVAPALAAFVVVCGHLLPMLIVRRNPEGVIEVLLPSFHVVVVLLRPVTRPLLRLLRGAGHRGNGAAPRANGAAAADETRETAADPHDGSTPLDDEEEAERELLQSVVDFGDTLVREVMTPRPDIVAVRTDTTLDQLRRVFVEERYSRLPVYEESLDRVLGFVFVKDLVALTDTPGSEQVVSRLLRPAYSVPETKRVADLLRELQRAQAQMAIVHDEFGGTAGLVTVEDLLEEIVGEIRDEYDIETEPIVDEGEGSFVFDGRVGFDDLCERLDVAIEAEGCDTVAAYLLARLGRVPQVGESFDLDGLVVDVLDGERRRVHRVRLRRQDRAAPDARADV